MGTTGLESLAVAFVLIRVTYGDGQGIVRDVPSATTDLGYVVANLEVERLDGEADMVAVSMDAEGRRHPRELVDSLIRLVGIHNVRTSESIG